MESIHTNFLMEMVLRFQKLTEAKLFLLIENSDSRSDRRYCGARELVQRYEASDLMRQPTDCCVDLDASVPTLVDNSTMKRHLKLEADENYGTIPPKKTRSEERFYNGYEMPRQTLNQCTDTAGSGQGWANNPWPPSFNGNTISSWNDQVWTNDHWPRNDGVKKESENWAEMDDDDGEDFDDEDNLPQNKQTDALMNKKSQHSQPIRPPSRAPEPIKSNGALRTLNPTEGPSEPLKPGGGRARSKRPIPRFTDPIPTRKQLDDAMELDRAVFLPSKDVRPILCYRGTMFRIKRLPKKGYGRTSWFCINQPKLACRAKMYTTICWPCSPDDVEYEASVLEHVPNCLTSTQDIYKKRADAEIVFKAKTTKTRARDIVKEFLNQEPDYIVHGLVSDNSLIKKITKKRTWDVVGRAEGRGWAIAGPENSESMLQMLEPKETVATDDKNSYGKTLKKLEPNEEKDKWSAGKASSELPLPELEPL